MNKYKKTVIVVIIILAMGVLFEVGYDEQNAKDNIQIQNNTRIDIIPSQTPYFNWNGFWFNNSECNETNTKSHYEPKKVDGQWQIIMVMTCLNQTVRIIPV